MLPHSTLTTLRRSLLLSGLALGIILLLEQTVFPQNDRAQPLRVTAVTVLASPARYEGPCPGVVRFEGSITFNGVGTVRYTWLRSDGATAPVSTLVFDRPGTKRVETTWTLGGAALPHYSGWQALRVLSPNVMVSSRAAFQLICRQAEPFKVTAVSVTAVPERYEGPCPGLIKFRGSITATGRGTVRYTWLRSDNASAPTSTLNFESAGTQTVETSWTLGGAALPQYNGWEALKILAPNPVTSAKAPFRLFCANPAPAAAVDLGIARGMVKIGGSGGGAGAKSVADGGAVTLTPADAFLQSGGQCAFNITYELVASGGGPRTPVFVNRIRADADVVSQQTNLSMMPGRSQVIRTQAYLPAGSHALTLTVDDDRSVHESNEGNNVVKIRIVVQCPGRP